jgi:glutaredoxin 2
MRKKIFQILAKLNKVLLPRLGKMDLNKLTTAKKALIAYKYWVITNALE